MPKCEIKQVGRLRPNFGAGSLPFSREFHPPSGILTEIQVYNRGNHTTAITTGQEDGELNIFRELKITINRKGLNPIIFNPLMRDAQHIQRFFEGHTPPRANPTASLANHFALTKYFLKPPERLLRNPNDWGLDTNEIDGPILIEGLYDAPAAIGTGATIVTNETDISVCVEKRRFRSAPLHCLTYGFQRIPHESAQAQGPARINHGLMDAMAALYLRHFDSSNPAGVDAPDGLITRHRIKHSKDQNLADDLYILAKKRSASRFGLPNAEVSDGRYIELFSPGFQAEHMPIMAGGQTMEIESDSQEVVPVEVTDVVPNDNDAIFAVPIGMMLTIAGLKELGIRR